MMREAGFTLVEVLVVLAIIGVVATLVPLGLNQLYSRSMNASFAQSIVDQLRTCASRAQLHQLATEAGSANCELKKEKGTKLIFEANIKPVFYADGTSNGAQLFLLAENNASQPNYSIVVDRFSSKVELREYAVKK